MVPSVTTESNLFPHFGRSHSPNDSHKTVLVPPFHFPPIFHSVQANELTLQVLESWIYYFVCSIQHLFAARSWWNTGERGSTLGHASSAPQNQANPAQGGAAAASMFCRAGVLWAVLRIRMFVKLQLEECSIYREWHGRSHKVQACIKNGLKDRGKVNYWGNSGNSVKLCSLQPWWRGRAGHTKAQRQDPCHLSFYVYNTTAYIWANHSWIPVESMQRNIWHIWNVYLQIRSTTFSCVYYSCWCWGPRMTRCRCFICSGESDPEWLPLVRKLWCHSSDAPLCAFLVLHGKRGCLSFTFPHSKLLRCPRHVGPSFLWISENIHRKTENSGLSDPWA